MRHIFYLCFLNLFLAACSDTVSLERQIDRLEQSLNAMRSQQASNTSDIDALQSNMRSLEGRLDEIQHFQDQRIGQEVSGLRNDISNLKSRVPPPAIVPVSALEVDEPILQTMNSNASRLVLDAIVFLRDGKYSEADTLLHNALEYGPEDPGFAYANFYGGVVADGRSDPSSALRAYNELVIRSPKHPRAPMALLRQADVFVRLHDKSAATLALKKLMADYSKSSEAAIAKQKLTDLGRK